MSTRGIAAAIGLAKLSAVVYLWWAHGWVAGLAGLFVWLRITITNESTGERRIE